MKQHRRLLELINRRQRQVLVHSFLYYQLGTSIIDDYTFDQWALELANLMKDNKETAKKSEYYTYFIDFDGSSGFDLPFAHPDIQSTGYRLLAYHEKKKYGEVGELY